MKLVVNNIEFNIDALTVIDDVAIAKYSGTNFNIDDLFAINNKEVTTIAEDGTDLAAYNYCEIEFAKTRTKGAFTIILTKIL